MFKLLILLVAVPAILARTPFRACTGGRPVPTAVFFGSRENPCLAEPCNISRAGGIGVTYVEFTTPFAARSIMPQVQATVFNGSLTFIQELPVEITNNPCQILTQGSCPLAAGQQAAYRLELPVDPSTPLIPTETQITLFGENEQVIFCYRLGTTLIQ